MPKIRRAPVHDLFIEIIKQKLNGNWIHLNKKSVYKVGVSCCKTSFPFLICVHHMVVKTYQNLNFICSFGCIWYECTHWLHIWLHECMYLALYVTCIWMYLLHQYNCIQTFRTILCLGRITTITMYKTQWIADCIIMTDHGIYKVSLQTYWILVDSMPMLVPLLVSVWNDHWYQWLDLGWWRRWNEH